MVSDAEGQAAATASMDQSAFAHMEKMLRDETKGEYTVGKMLGRGGMAVVYLAEETRLGRKVALKVLPPELTFGHGVDRFLREAKTAATLDHPNIIPIYRIASGGKLFWYAMKFLEGKSLEDVLRERGAYSVDETIELLEQVADALDYAHEHQVIHRDIKPANVMLDSRNRVIITDFGIAKALSEGALTASGSVIGTPYFMSPEQGMGKPVSGAADQYSVAVMAFRMLAGHIPFDGDSAIDILHKHCMMDPPRLEESAPHVPRHVCDAVDKALSKKADDRFPNIRAFVRAMKDPTVKYTRPSARTEVIDTNELEKKNSGPRPKVVPRAGAADKTVVAGAAVRPAAAAPAKSNAAMYAVIALVVLGGGGFGAWKFLGSSSAPASQVVADAPPTTPTDAGASSSGSQPPASTPTPEPEPVTPDAAPTKSAAPPPQTTPRQTAQPSAPQTRPQTPPTQQTPIQQTPVQQTPAPAPSTPAAAPAAGGPGTLQIILTTPGKLSIDGVDKGERARYSEPLSAGDHLLRVERDGFVTKDTVVTVRAGETVRVTLSLTPRP
ncbi:MAG: serine/threonine protein kinase [Gemmatimonadaceae bacterium]|nr:serine/threonine protein kinase [Gemmatimonadaceae bacterium]MCW5826561.1 serine/threonine protein kinase [Gemmatimonadaceae bacterium]